MPFSFQRSSHVDAAVTLRWLKCRFPRLKEDYRHYHCIGICMCRRIIFEEAHRRVNAMLGYDAFLLLTFSFIYFKIFAYAEHNKVSLRFSAFCFILIFAAMSNIYFKEDMLFSPCDISVTLPHTAEANARASTLIVYRAHYLRNILRDSRH